MSVRGMSYVRVSSVEKLLSASDIQQIDDNAKAALQSAIAAVGKQPQAYVIRDILPVEDLGLSSEAFTFKYSTTGWQTIVNQTLPDDKFIVIYAVEFPTPNPLTGAVKFYRNVDPLFVASVSKMLGYETPVMYVNPVVWSQNQVLRIDTYANATGTEYMVLKGYVAELCGKTVTCK
jgi:hypothetical protein